MRCFSEPSLRSPQCVLHDEECFFLIYNNNDDTCNCNNNSVSLMSKQACATYRCNTARKGQTFRRFNIFFFTFFFKTETFRMILKSSILIVVVGIIVYYAYEWARSKLLRIQKLELQLSQFVSPHPQDVKEDPSELISCPVSENRVERKSNAIKH